MSLLLLLLPTWLGPDLRPTDFSTSCFGEDAWKLLLPSRLPCLIPGTCKLLAGPGGFGKWQGVPSLAPLEWQPFGPMAKGGPMVEAIVILDKLSEMPAPQQRTSCSFGLVTQNMRLRLFFPRTALPSPQSFREPSNLRFFGVFFLPRRALPSLREARPSARCTSATAWGTTAGATRVWRCVWWPRAAWSPRRTTAATGKRGRGPRRRR